MNKKLWIVLSVIFIVHLAAGCFCAFHRTAFFLHNDGDEYFALTQSFAQHGKLLCDGTRYYEVPHASGMPEAHRVQLLSISTGILAFVFRNAWFSAALMMAVLTGIVSWQMYDLGSRLNGQPAGWLALIGFNIHPMLMQYSVQFCTEIPFICALLLVIRCLLSLNDDWRGYIFLGASLAISALVRPTGLAVCVMVPLWLFVRLILEHIPSQMKKIKAEKIVVTLGVCFLLLSPVGICNLVNYGSFSLTGYLGGFNFYLGNNRDNLAAYCSSSGKDFLKHQNRAWDRTIGIVQSLPYSGDPRAQDAAMKKLTIDEIKQMGLADYVRLTFGKAWQFIRPWPLPGVHPPVMFWGITLFELCLYIFGISGMWLLRKQWPLLIPFALVLLAGWSAHSISHVYMRHRIPFVDPALILFSAAAVSCLFSRCFISILENHEK